MYYFIVFFIAYVFGIIFSIYVNFAYILIAGVVLFTISSIINKKIVFNGLIVLFIVLSFVTTNYNSKSVLRQYINNDIEIVANVVSVNSQKDESKYIGYNVCVTSINGMDIKEKSILYVEKIKNIALNSTIQTNVEVSDILSNKNRMLFNYKNSLRSDNIFVTLFCVSDVGLIKEKYSKLNEFSIYTKQKTEKLFRDFMSEENANTVLSVLLGDIKYLDKDFYKNIQKTGLAHVFAVSGLHIAIIYAAFLKIFMLLGISRRASWFISWGILWIYGFIIGFPVTVLRSLLMFNFLFGAEALYRKYSSINSLIVSALILLVVNPFYLFDVGFQLSYMAALCLFFYNQIIKVKFNIKNEILSSLVLYIFVQIFTFPIMSYYFNYISIIGILYNLLVVPLFSGVIILAFAVLAISFISIYTIVIPLKLLDYMLHSVNYLINIGAGLNITGLELASMTVLQSAYYYLFIAVFLFALSYKKLQYKWLLFILLCVFYTIDLVVMPISYNGLKIDVVDVGQGLFINLNYNNYNFVFDAGSKSDNIGKYVTVPYLIKHGRKNIDSVFLSHFHDDHYSGIGDIINNCKVKSVFTSSYDKKELIPMDCKILKGNQSFKLKDNFNIKILWPDKDYFSTNENNMSNVYLLEFGNVKLLFTGDIEKEVEDIILDRMVDVDIVVVPHHGSKTSSSDEFLNKIRPEISIFSYGENNYGIPGQEVIDRYNSIGSKVLSTFIDGEINIMVIKDKIYYNTYIGNHSENMDEIYRCNFILNIFAFVMIMSIVLVNKNYVLDKRYEGNYEL